MSRKAGAFGRSVRGRPTRFSPAPSSGTMRRLTTPAQGGLGASAASPTRAWYPHHAQPIAHLPRPSQPAPHPRLVRVEFAAEGRAQRALLGLDLEAVQVQDEDGDGRE